MIVLKESGKEKVVDLSSGVGILPSFYLLNNVYAST